MAYTLTFNELHEYGTTDEGINIPIRLSREEKSVDFVAKVDTGASFCIFQRNYGMMLGLNIEAGLLQEIRTGTLSFTTYGHDLLLSVLTFRFEIMAYFAADPAFRRNVLGQRGWLEQIGLGIIHYSGKLYISKYDDMI